MKDLRNYQTNVERRFHCHVSLWASLFAFFSLPPLFEDAINEIKKKDILGSFKGDAEQLRKDFDKICN